MQSNKKFEKTFAAHRSGKSKFVAHLLSLIEKTRSNGINKKIKPLDQILDATEFMIINLLNNVISIEQFTKNIYENLLTDENFEKIMNDIKFQLEYRLEEKQDSESATNKYLLSIADHYAATAFLTSLYAYKNDFQGDSKISHSMMKEWPDIQLKKIELFDSKSEKATRFDGNEPYIKTILDDMNNLFQNCTFFIGEKNFLYHIGPLTDLWYYIPELLQDENPQIIQTYLFCYCLSVIEDKRSQWDPDDNDLWRHENFMQFTRFIKAEMIKKGENQEAINLLIKTAGPILTKLVIQINKPKFGKNSGFHFLTYRTLFKKYIWSDTPIETIIKDLDPKRQKMMELLINEEKKYHAKIAEYVFSKRNTHINISFACKLFSNLLLIAYLKNMVTKGEELNFEKIKKETNVLMINKIFTKKFGLFQNDLSKFLKNILNNLQTNESTVKLEK